MNYEQTISFSYVPFFCHKGNYDYRMWQQQHGIEFCPKDKRVTTRHVLLPGGSIAGKTQVVTNASESGYNDEGWGTAAQGGSHGTWRITGNIQEGTLTFVYSSGEAWEYHYIKVAGDYVSLGSTKYGIAGTPDC